MHPQGPASTGDVHQPGHEVRELGDQGGELVDDDHQPRHGLVARLHGGDVVLNVLGVGVLELMLTAPQLGAQRLQRPGRQVPVEVGDHADRVREARAVLEGGTALVVHEHEGHRLGRIAHAQGGDEGLKQLGLTRTGRAGHQGVRAVGAHVQPEDALGVLADDGARGAADPLPRLQDGGGVGLGHAQHVQEARCGRNGAVRILGRDVVDRGQAAGHPFAPPVRDEVQKDVLDLVDVGLGDRGQAGACRHDGAALLGQRGAIGVDADEADAHSRPLAQDPDHARAQAQRIGAVEHHQHLSGALRKAPAAIVVLRADLDDLEQLIDAAVHRLLINTHLAARPHALGVAQMREPPRPGPPVLRLRSLIGIRDEHHLELGRRVQNSALRGQPADHPVTHLAGDPDGAQFGQGHGDRHVRRGPAHRLLVARPHGLGHHHATGQVRRAHPQLEPVAIRGPSLPQLGARARGAQERLGGIGGVQAPQAALLGQRLEGGLLGGLALLLIALDVLAVVLLVVGAPLDSVGDHHDRREDHEHQRIDAMRHEVHPQPHDERGQHHGEGESLLARTLGLAREDELRLPLRARQAGRPVEVDGGASRRGRCHGVGRGHRSDREHDPAHRQHHALIPRALLVQGATVQLDQVPGRLRVESLPALQDRLLALLAPLTPFLLLVLAPLALLLALVVLVLILVRGQDQGPGQGAAPGHHRRRLPLRDALGRAQHDLRAHLDDHIGHNAVLEALEHDVAARAPHRVVAQSEPVDGARALARDDPQLHDADGLDVVEDRSAQAQEHPVPHGPARQRHGRVEAGGAVPQGRGGRRRAGRILRAPRRPHDQAQGLPRSGVGHRPIGAGHGSIQDGHEVADGRFRLGHDDEVPGVRLLLMRAQDADEELHVIPFRPGGGAPRSPVPCARRARPSPGRPD